MDFFSQVKNRDAKPKKRERKKKERLTPFFSICKSGYDFGYLLKVLTCSVMPADESEFFELLRTYFPCIYDIKYLMKSCKNLKGGLQDIADDLQVSFIF